MKKGDRKISRPRVVKVMAPRRYCYMKPFPILPRFASLTLHRSGGVISGQIGGRNVQSTVRLAGGTSLAPGDYQIHPPVNDPIYGMVAHMTPANLPVTGLGRFTLGAEPGIVLSNRPVIGQKSLIIQIGFAELMDALEAAGGAKVTVS